MSYVVLPRTVDNSWLSEASRPGRWPVSVREDAVEVTMNRVTPSPMYGDSVPEVNTNLCPQLTSCWCQDPEEDVDVASAILTFISLSLCVLLFPVSWLVCLMVVAEYERTIVFRLGKVRRGGARGPGIIWTLPCLDTAVVVDLRTGVYDIPSQDVLTKDSISVCVNAVVFWRVVDPMLAVTSSIFILV